MKNFFKKLAVTLALAMVVTSIPSNTASAAVGITLKSGSKAGTLRVGKAYRLKLGNSKAKWTSSNKKVATVGLTGGVLKGRTAGKVTITAKSLKTGKTFKKTYTMVKRATNLELGSDITVGVGATTTIAATLTPSDSTDAVRYYSTDKTVVKVGSRSGKVTGVKAGTATIAVYSKATAGTSNKNRLNLKGTITVKVGAVIESAVQSTTTKLNVNFNSEMKDEKASDFTITAEDKSVKNIKAVEIDGATVTVETFAKLNDGKAYTVTYKKGTEAESSYKFTATDGKIATLGITPATVVYGVPTTISVVTKDVNGVELDKYAYNDTAAEPKLSFTVSTMDGSLVGSKLKLDAVGKTATAKAVYHTYQYENGKEVGALEAALTITAVDKTAVTLKTQKMTVATSQPSNWDTATLNDKLAVKDTNYNVYVYLKDSNGNVTTSSEGYYLATSDKDTLMLTSTTTAGCLSASVQAVAQGSAFVLVKNSKGETVASFPTNLVAERKAAGIALGATSFELSNASTPADSKEVKVTVNDQYGVKLAAYTDNASDITVACVNAPTTDAKLTAGNNTGNTYFEKAADKVEFKAPAGSAAGVYQYTVTAGGYTASVYVTVKTTGDITTAVDCDYAVVLSSKDVDLKFNKTTKEYTDLTVKVAAYVNGTFVGYVPLAGTGSTDESTDADGLVVKNGSTVVTGASIERTGNTPHVAIKVGTVSGTAVTKDLATGDYTVQVAYKQHTYATATGLTEKANAATITATRTFKVSDSEASLSASCVKETYTAASSVKDGVANAFEFYFDGAKQSVTATNVADVEYTANGASYHITKVTVNVDIDGYQVPVSVTMSKTITLSTGLSK